MMARSIPAPMLPRTPSNVLFRTATAILRSHGAGITPEDAAKTLFGKDQVILRAASAPAKTTDSGWAGPLARQVVSDLLQSIVSISAGAALLTRALQINFDHLQSIRLPSRLVDPAYAGQWTAEGAPIPVFQYPVSAGKTLTPHRLSVISVFTREMIDTSNIEMFVRSLLSESAALAVDKALFGSQADDSITPPGLLNGVTPITAASGGSDRFANMAEDIEALIAQLASAGGGAEAVFVCAPGQAAAMKTYVGPKFDYPILASMVLPAGQVICIEPCSLVATISAATPEFSVAENTLLHMETVPADIVAGSPSTPTKSLFQLDALALKMTLRDLDWKMRASHVSFVSGTNW
jgi:hypothetical protein